MINGQIEFRSSCLVETFSAEVAMPEHPTPFDDPVKAVGVIRAEDVPRSLVLNGIRFASFHSALLSVPHEKAEPLRKNQILQSNGH